MLTNKLFIYKIDNKANIKVLQLLSEYHIQWSFENGMPRSEYDNDFYPFKFPSSTRPIVRNPGPETRSSIAVDGEIFFSDDYSVPYGTAIGILFPPNYVLDVFKFKEKPFIPSNLIGQVSSTPPGQFAIHYNFHERTCAIVFIIHQNTFFGFACKATKISNDSFSKINNNYIESPFDLSISRELLKVEAIQTSDLQIINEALNNADIEDVLNCLNLLLKEVKAGNRTKAKSILERTAQTLVNGTSVASSLVTIADSYKTGGAVNQFISKVVSYAAL